MAGDVLQLFLAIWGTVCVCVWGGAFCNGGRFVTSQCHKTSPRSQNVPEWTFCNGGGGGTFCNIFVAIWGTLCNGGRFATIFLAIWGTFCNGEKFCNDFFSIWGDVLQRGTFCNAKDVASCLVVNNYLVSEVGCTFEFVFDSISLNC